MFEVRYIPHHKISEITLDLIIGVKTKAWDYSKEQQKEWMYLNLKDSDIHVLLFQNSNAVAYLNLIDITINVDGFDVPTYGVGNVCATKRGAGFGKQLILAMNSYLKLEEKTGLLFCRDALVKFYSSNGWLLVARDKLSVISLTAGVNTMIFNVTCEYSEIGYHGKLF